MRLIDADLLTDGKGVFSKFIKCSDDFVAYIEIQDLLKVLENAPTAFDTEQVIHNLECEKTIWVGKKITTTEVMKIDDAIDIVKKGGVE